MSMHYGHPEDGDKPCHCPRCGWSGTLHQTDEYTPSEGGKSHQVCPKCAAEVPVISDELEGMAWWNGLDDYERRRWMGFAGNTGKAADAWAEWKRCVPTFLDDDGPLADIPNLITKPRR